MSCVADDFETNASLYEPHELVYTLRAYGHLNYVPPNSGAFFTAVESILMAKFSEFDALFILELLASFVYVERFPINFLGHIFSPHFLMHIKGLLFASLSTLHLSMVYLCFHVLLVASYQLVSTSSSTSVLSMTVQPPTKQLSLIELRSTA